MLLTQYIETQFADAPELLDQVVPDVSAAREADPARQRHLGRARSSATTCTSRPTRSTRITPDGIVTADGREHEVDVIVYATGFEASRFLMPMQITGRGGRRPARALGRRRARAISASRSPGFPNLFCLYGPNTNLVAERQHHLLLRVRRALHRRARCTCCSSRTQRALDCRAEVSDAYNERVDEANARMAWGVSTVNSWYKNADGQVTQNWPFTLLEFWQRTRSPDPADYELL